MKLKFKEQQYQNNAVNSVINCFSGEVKQTRKELIGKKRIIVDEGTLFEYEQEDDIIYFSNHKMTLSETDIRNNIRNVQRDNNINYTDNAGITDYTIEMETGTGKTFTYIQTMYELNKEYNWSKFIVMVPSIAIREGVEKTFKITEDYFQEKYHKKIRYFVYNTSNKSNIANINSFASDNSIWVMIINYQAFNGKENSRGVNKKIYDSLDELQSRRPIDVINKARPIIIIDEPQKFGNPTLKKLENFKPLFTIRYSATHKKEKEYNKIYKLDAIDAYNQKLVKKINVKGIEVLNNKSENTYLFLDRVDISTKHDPIAWMEIEVKTSTGVTRKLMKFKKNDRLYEKSGGLAEYNNYVISEINAIEEAYDKVYFSNGEEIAVGQVTGDVDAEYITRIQIRETIHSHLEKEKELYKKGIKVLSLFFIDEVAKYKYYEDGTALKGEYAKMFEEEYIKALSEYRSIVDENYLKYLDSFDTGKIHAGYFSIDKKKKDNNGDYIFIENEKSIKKDDEGNRISFDNDAYDLIMKDKERLLSLSEPVRFIFSHSALREGWDNPNIFQICTLKHSNSEISKRQEIGRGLRICVNNDGERMDSTVLDDSNFHNINTLTVIASESYDSFAKSLQKEIAESLTSRPKNFVQENFINKTLKNDNGDEFIFTSEDYQDLLFYNVEMGYIDRKNNYKITDKFIEDLENDKLKVMDDLKPFKEEYVALMKKLYLANNTKLVNDERRENIKNLVPNSNFMKKEWQELWNKINYKSVYEVDFDSDELIKKAIDAINVRLNVNKMKVRITEGMQKEEITSVSINTGESMTDGKTKTETVEDFSPSQIEYDLIGEITKSTGLTRKTIVKILMGITPQKFSYFKYLPEEFIRKVSNIINEEKATTIIDGITYHKTDEKFTNDIFTINNVRGELGENAIDVKKSIYDYLVTDSKNEEKFARKLESGEVTVYAKLPSGFKIPTPVGNYNPDWAIVLDNPSFKYVYFIAETKGDLSSLQLRDVEKAKIECAKKHFALLSTHDVKYGAVASYQDLIDLLE